MEHASSFKNKVALVDGGASGMGKAVAHMLTDAGCKTHIFDIKDAANGDFQHCNIRDHSQVHRCIADLVAHEGRIDLPVGKTQS